MLLSHDWQGEDKLAVDAMRQAILSEMPRSALMAFEFPFYSSKTGREARCMAQVMFGLDERQGERLMGVVRPELHLIGHGAMVGEYPCTESNRDSLSGVLRLYFEGPLADRVTTNRDTRVGLAILLQMISQFEIVDTLGWLSSEHLDLATLIDLKYAKN